MCLAADGFAQVYPEHKYLIVECLRELGYKTGMTGDGVNDAPALKRADVGVAVQGATDAARAAADIVLTQPGLSTIVNGILISRRIFVRIKNFLTYRIAATLQLLIFFFIAVFAYRPVEFMPADWKTNPDFPDDSEWPAFFHMPVLMLMLITLLNDGTLIAIGYDNVEAREVPEKWNLKVLYLVSSVLAAVALISSLVLLDVLSLSPWVGRQLACELPRSARLGLTCRLGPTANGWHSPAALGQLTFKCANRRGKKTPSQSKIVHSENRFQPTGRQRQPSPAQTTLPPLLFTLMTSIAD
jgi:hypothetical protein